MCVCAQEWSRHRLMAQGGAPEHMFAKHVFLWLGIDGDCLRNKSL